MLKLPYYQWNRIPKETLKLNNIKTNYNRNVKLTVPKPKGDICFIFKIKQKVSNRVRSQNRIFDLQIELVSPDRISISRLNIRSEDRINIWRSNIRFADEIFDLEILI